MTHGHPRCQVACAVYSLLVAALLEGAELPAARASALGRCRAVYAADPALAGHLAALDELEAWPERAGRGFVLDSFWSAWEAVAGAADYADAIRRAVAYGHDTDTTAAIAGGLAGAHWGWEGIPTAWRRSMRGTSIVTPLVDELVGRTGARTSRASPLSGPRGPRLSLPAVYGAGRVGRRRDGTSGQRRCVPCHLACHGAGGRATSPLTYSMTEQTYKSRSRAPRLLPAVQFSLLPPALPAQQSRGRASSVVSD